LRKLRSLERRVSPSLGDMLHLYSPATGKDHYVNLADLQGGGGYSDWDSTAAANGDYDTGSKVSYGLKLWESLVDDNATVPSENGSWTEVSAETTTFEKIYERVALTAHGFAIGECLKKGATVDSWVLIDGTADTQEALRGLVISVPDANNFVVALPASRVRGLSGLTAGAIHYADASGVLTDVATDVKVLFADSATTGYMIAGGGSAGGGGGPAIAEVYANIAAMLADQGAQEQNAYYWVTDATTDSTVTSGWAIYRKLAASTANLTDYVKVQEQESLDIVVTDASETVKGIVEEATAAEIWSGASTGATGAKLFTTPAKLNTSKAIVDLGDVSGTVSIDLATGINFKCRATGNITSFTYTNLTEGVNYIIEITTETSAKTIAFASGVFSIPLGSVGTPQLSNCTQNGSSPAKAIDLLTLYARSATRLVPVITPDVQDN